MRITYYSDNTGFLWACIYEDDKKYNHYFIGKSDRDNRKLIMYNLLSKGNSNV